MNYQILLVTHSRMAEGIKDTLTMIAGDNDRVRYLTMYCDPNIDYQKVVYEAVAQHDYSASDLVVITDIAGGSVNTEFMKHLNRYPFHLITGLSLPMLLEIAFPSEADIGTQLRLVARNAGIYGVYCNDMLNDAKQTDSLF